MFAPNESMLEPQATLTPCHPELVSGSSPRNIIPSPENVNNIPFAFHTAKRHVRGDYVPQKESNAREVAGNVQFSASLNNPRHVSGSNHRNIIVSPENTKNITSASHTAQRHVRGGLAICKAAFTLAEVLITLGIIGVVAAMTLPTLISKYKRNVVEVKLEKFYSIMNQAVKMAIAEYGEIPFENQYNEGAQNAVYIENWYKTYLTKYIKIIKEEGSDKSGAYYRVAFLDGSGFNSYMSTAQDDTRPNSALYIFFCLNYSKCTYGKYDGSNSFLFVYEPTKQRIEPAFSGDPFETLKSTCYNSDTGRRWRCAALIQQNGWKIPDDYPWL